MQGDIVVVACGAANSAKLLLASATDKHPGGLANGSDQVGRNFMYHDSQAVLALSKDPNPTVFQKTLGLNDFYFRGPDFDYPMGNIQMIGKSQAAMFRGEKPLETKFAPNWALRDVAEHAVDFWLTTEDLPLPDNRVTLGPDGGIHLAYTPSNPTAAKQLFGQLHSMLGSLRMQPGHLAHRFAYLKTDIPVAGCAHQAGTVPVRHRPGHLGAQRRLQGPRARQPLRRRHQLLPQHRRGQPGPDRDGQRHPGRRPPAEPDVVNSFRTARAGGDLRALRLGLGPGR